MQSSKAFTMRSKIIKKGLLKMNKLEKIINEKLMPLAEKLTKNKVLGALMEGFIRTSPITLGIAFITIIGNFPVPGWTQYLDSKIGRAHV